ncbi:FtsQ-type POTRA domain-containing protein [Candidatus Peregrinibacteria bacterium]|nr:FtsQ-type POTRA domain-containing protein [Candidatus Peregrinibacteria bacterium]
MIMHKIYPKMLRNKRNLKKLRTAYSQSHLKTKSLQKRKSSRKLLKRRHPFITKIKRFAVIVGIVAGGILIVNLLFFSNYFKISDIDISDKNFENEKLGQEIEKALSDALGKNLLFLDTEELKLKVLNAFPEIEKIEIKKDYPGNIIVELAQFPLVANVINESRTVKKSYIINSIGYAIKEDFENPALPYIKMKSDEPVNTENPVIEVNKLKYILDTITYFEDKFGMRIIEVEYKKIPREIHLLTEKNFYVWLDIQKSAEKQLKKLKKSLVKLDIYNENLEYIDLRIAGENGDKIIYKRR